MEENIRYDFCRRCGGLVKDGVCTSCGWFLVENGKQKWMVPPQGFMKKDNTESSEAYEKEDTVQPDSCPDPEEEKGEKSEDAVRQDPEPESTESEEIKENLSAPQPEKVSYKGWLILGGVLLAVLFISFLILAFVIVGNVASRNRAESPGTQESPIEPYQEEDPNGLWKDPSAPNPDEYGSAWDYFSDYFGNPNKKTEGTYTPSAEDEYYEGLTDAVREDLSYKITWEEYDLSANGGKITAVGTYPQIQGGNIPNLEEVNKYIETEANYYKENFGEYLQSTGEDITCHTVSNAYVTYMDEDRISIVLDEQVNLPYQTYVGLFAINVDLNTGTIMQNDQILNFDEELVQRFREQSSLQNGENEFLNSLSDEELFSYLSSQELTFLFYTPVGLEVGINYSTEDSVGWISVTLKDFQRYTPKY